MSQARNISMRSTGCKFHKIALLVLLGLWTQSVKAFLAPEQIGSSSATATLQLFGDAAYKNEYTGVPTLSTSDILYIQVSVNLNDASQIKSVVRQCWATPSTSVNDVNKLFLINSPGCAGSSVHTQITSNGQATYARFQYNVFSFRSSDTVTLRCRLELCTGNCVPSCSSKRKRDEFSSYEEGGTVSQTFIVGPPSSSNYFLPTLPGNVVRSALTTTSSATEKNDASRNTRTIYIVIIALGGVSVFCLLLVIATFGYRVRRTRMHKKKINSNEHLYLVVT